MPPPLPVNAIEAARRIRWDGKSATCEMLYPGKAGYSKIAIARLNKQYPYFARLLRLAHQKNPWDLTESLKTWLPVASKTEQYLVIMGYLIPWHDLRGLAAPPAKKSSPEYVTIRVDTPTSKLFSSPEEFETNFPGSSVIVAKCAKLFASEGELATIVKALLVEPLSRLPWSDPSGKDVSTALDFAHGLSLDAAQTSLYIQTLLDPFQDGGLQLPDAMSY